MSMKRTSAPRLFPFRSLLPASNLHTSSIVIYILDIMNTYNVALTPAAQKFGDAMSALQGLGCGSSLCSLERAASRMLTHNRCFT